MDSTMEYQKYISELGNRIKLYRISKEMSQQDIADKMGISKRSVARLEQGNSVQIETLFKILLALDIGDNIEMLVPDQTKSPSYYLEKNVKLPKRVRKKKEKAPFKWGDEV